MHCYFRWSELNKLEAMIISHNTEDETRERNGKFCIFADKQTLETGLALQSSVEQNQGQRLKT